MRIGFDNRAVGETQMNARSSRSHSVFIIKVDVADNDIKALAASSDPGKHLRQGRLNLVDLAGSERQSKTGAQVIFLFLRKLITFRMKDLWKQLKLTCH